MRLPVRFLAGGMLLCVCALAADAELIPVEEVHPPLVNAFWLTSDYDADGGTAGRGLLEMTATTTAYDDGSGPARLVPFGTFSLSVEIDKSTKEATSGTLLVTGNNQTLFYSDEVVDFGFAAETRLEFLFRASEDTVLVAQGTPIGVFVDAWQIVYPGTTNPMPYETWSTFGEDFHSTGYKADAFSAVPTPSGFVLGMIGLGTVGLLKRRFGRHGPAES